MAQPTTRPVTTFEAILGQLLKSYRETLSLGQGKMAQRVGVSQPYWSKVEQGKAHPSVALIRRASTALSVPYSRLLAEAESACEEARKRGVRIVEEEQTTEDWLPYVGAAALGALIAIALKRQ